MGSRHGQILRILVVTMVAIVGMGFVASLLPPSMGRILAVLVGLAVMAEGLWLMRSGGSPSGRRLERARRLTDERLRAKQNEFFAATGREMTVEEIQAARRKIAMGDNRKAIGKGIVGGSGGSARGRIRGTQPPEGHPDGPQ